MLRAVAARPSRSAVFDGRRARAYRLRARRRSGGCAPSTPTTRRSGTPTRTPTRRPPPRPWTRSRRACASASAAARRMRSHRRHPPRELVRDGRRRRGSLRRPARRDGDPRQVQPRDGPRSARGRGRRRAPRSIRVQHRVHVILPRRRRGRVDRRPAPRTGRAPPRPSPVAPPPRAAARRSQTSASPNASDFPYALRDDEIPASLAAELVTLRRDVTSRRVGGGRAPVRHSTADTTWRWREARWVGWCGSNAGLGRCPPASDTRNGAPVANAPDGLSLRDAIPSDEAEGAALAIEYLQWLCEAGDHAHHRGVSAALPHRARQVAPRRGRPGETGGDGARARAARKQDPRHQGIARRGRGGQMARLAGLPPPGETLKPSARR